MYSGRWQAQQDACGFSGARPRLGSDSTQQLHEGRPRGRQNVLRHGRRRLPPRHQRPPIRVYGQVRHDADAGHPVRHQQRRRFARQIGPARLLKARKICGHHRRFRQSARGCPAAGKRKICNERRKNLQAGTVKGISIISRGESMKIRTLLFAALVVLLFVRPVRAQLNSTSQSVAIKAGKLLDPETGKTTANQIILVEGNRIKEIGGNVAIPAEAKIIDLSKATVLPGLFDAHTHLCMAVIPGRDQGNYYFTTLLDSTGYRAIEGVANGMAMLQSGFTTVRDIGNAGNYADTDLRHAIENGWVQGPTVVNAGIIIAPYGGQFHLQPEKKDLATPEYLFADTRDEMRKAIRQNIHFGAKVIKIVVDDQDYIYSTEDIRFMIAEAHASGLKLAAHCWTHAGAHNAAEAGVDSIEHGFRMTDEDLQLAKKN